MIIDTPNVTGADGSGPFAQQLKAVLRVALDARTRRWAGEPKDVQTIWGVLFNSPQPPSLWSGPIDGAFWELYPEGRFVRHMRNKRTQKTEATIFSWNADDDREAPPQAAVKLLGLIETAQKMMPPVDLGSFLNSARDNFENRAPWLAAALGLTRDSRDR